MALHIWRNLRTDLPEDWELLQFSRSSDEGRCAFADRYDFRFELSWREVPGPPDFDRMMSDYESKLKEQGVPNTKHVSIGEWQGLETRNNGSSSSRYGRYFPEESCLVEGVFPWPHGRRDRKLARRVLESINVEPSGVGDMRRWRVFGMDFLVSNGLALEECSFLPGKAEMSFSDPKGRSIERFTRLGMVDDWLRGTVVDWLKAQFDERDEVTRRETTRVNGHAIEQVHVTHTRKGANKVHIRRRKSRAAAWICPSSGRLYCVKIQGAWKKGQEGPAAVDRMACCPAKELG